MFNTTRRTPTVFFCAICIDDLFPVTEDHNFCTPCGHVFHELCLMSWLKSFPEKGSPSDNNNNGNENVYRGTCPNCACFVDLAACTKVYLDGEEPDVATKHHYEEDRRVRAELAQAQSDLKRYGDLYNDLRTHYEALRKENQNLRIKVGTSASAPGTPTSTPRVFDALPALTPSPMALAAGQARKYLFNRRTRHATQLVTVRGTDRLSPIPSVVIHYGFDTGNDPPGQETSTKDDKKREGDFPPPEEPTFSLEM